MQGTGLNRRKRVIVEIAFLCLLLLLIAIDQITKYHFSTTLELGDRVAVIDGFFYFSYVLNNGAAWSFLSEVSWAQTFFKIITIIYYNRNIQKEANYVFRGNCNFKSRI